MNFRRLFMSSKLQRSVIFENVCFCPSKSNRPKMIETSTLFSQSKLTYCNIANKSITLDLSRFNNTLPSFIAELVDTDVFKEEPILADRYKENLEYNMTVGRRQRAMMLIHMYRELTSNYTPMDNEIMKIYVLAWCCEIMTSWSVIFDDAVDSSQYRRGRLSWYYKKDKHLDVVYDADLLRESVYVLLNKYLSQDENYKACLNIFRQMILRVDGGQMVDVLLSQSKHSDGKTMLEKYNFDIYHRIAYNKTGFSSYYMPMSLAMTMAGKLTPSNEQVLNQMTVLMGNYWQVQNDFLDVYGNPERTGKTGTDIEDGKCTWLILTALELCSPQQREILELNYGQRDLNRVRKIKEVFEELDLQHKYREYETALRANIIDQISRCSDLTLKAVLKRILEATFRDEA